MSQFESQVFQVVDTSAVFQHELLQVHRLGDFHEYFARLPQQRKKPAQQPRLLFSPQEDIPQAHGT